MLSEKIRELRKRSGLSQEELAERIDVSRQAVSKWELGSATPTADKLVELADLFGVSLDHLMRDIPEDAPTQKAPKTPARPHPRRKIAAWCLIVTALLGFALLGVLCTLNALARVSYSFTFRLDGVGVIAFLAVLCAAIGVALLISLKK